MLKNISWCINLCLKFFMTHTKTFRPFDLDSNFNRQTICQTKYVNWNYLLLGLVLVKEYIWKSINRRVDLYQPISETIRSSHPEAEITLQHGCSPVNLPHILRTRYPKNTSGGLLLNNFIRYSWCLYCWNGMKLQRHVNELRTSIL